MESQIRNRLFAPPTRAESENSLRLQIKGGLQVKRFGLHIGQYSHHEAFVSVRRTALELVDYLLPPVCMTCNLPLLYEGANHWDFCTECEKQLVRLIEPLCELCGVRLRPEIPVRPEPDWQVVCPECKKHPRAFVKARAPFAHSHTGRSLVLALKRGKRFRVARWMTPIFLETCSEVIEPSEIIVPVPLSKRRLRRRHFNQSALLSLHLARALEIPMVSDSLVRIYDNPKQVGQSYQQRLDNVAGCFAVVRKHLVAGKKVLLLDDVVTSGATANVCAQALLKAGASEVRVLSISRTLRGFGVGESLPRLLAPNEQRA